MKTRAEKERMGRRRQALPWWTLLVSLLFNGAAVLFVTGVAGPLMEKARTPPPAPAPLEWAELAPVDITRPPDLPQPRQQIVDTAYANKEEPDEARYLGEESSRVEKETAGKWGALPKGERAPTPKPGSGTGESGEQREKSGKAENIFPTREQVAEILAQNMRERRGSGGTEGTGSPNADLPMLPPGSGLDALDPTIESGAYTLLNQKSFRYAGFLNRVFRQVSSQYIRQLYSSTTFTMLSTGESGWTVVETILNPRGEPLSTKIVRFEGSPTLAEVARYAMSQGAWDLNPPAGIESEDGNIHLVLVANVAYAGFDSVRTPRYRGQISFGVL